VLLILQLRRGVAANGSTEVHVRAGAKFLACNQGSS
jgi:hypothetical protein